MKKQEDIQLNALRASAKMSLFTSVVILAIFAFTFFLTVPYSKIRGNITPRPSCMNF